MISRATFALMAAAAPLATKATRPVSHLDLVENSMRHLTDTETAEQCSSISELAETTPDLSTLFTAISAAPSVSADLSTLTEELTVFAPSNDAWALQPPELLEALLAMPGAVTDLLEVHVVPGSVFAEDLMDGDVLETANGGNLTVSVIEGTVFLTAPGEGGAMGAVVLPDVGACNGVVHIIDSVLIPGTPPSDMPTPTPPIADPVTPTRDQSGPAMLRLASAPEPAPADEFVEETDMPLETSPPARTGEAGRVFRPFPEAEDTVQLEATIDVEGTFDGGMARFNLNGGDQGEDQDPLFELEDGATIENVIIGPAAADGIHCRGTCLIRNVWWEDVGEDAATLKGKDASFVMTIDGGGARLAEDKTFQHNGGGTLIVRNFQAQSIGKLVRSCGTCGGDGNNPEGKRIVVENCIVSDVGSDVVGINIDKGDTATISGLTVADAAPGDVRICGQYEGTSRVGAGPGNGCNYSDSDVEWM